MSDAAIQKMHDFDWEVFKQERIYRLHTQDLGIGIFDEPSAKQEDKSALMKKFLESVSRWDDYTTASRYGWIEEVDDPSIYKQLQALRKADLELLTLIVVDGLSQTEIAAVLGCSPQNIFGRLKKIRKRNHNPYHSYRQENRRKDDCCRKRHQDRGRSHT